MTQMTPETTHSAAVAEAFSHKAGQYDAFGQDHPLLTRMREKVYAHIQSVRATGDRLLELNAGTGTDAVQLARRGFNIHAVDLSPGMVAAFTQKIKDLKLEDRLSVTELSFTELDKLDAEPFDGVISNFGGLNCIPDLRAVTRHLPRLLRPGGTVTWVIMPRVCPWEMGLIAKDRRVAMRRWHRGGVMAHVEGVHFRTYYFSAREAERAFGPQFKRVKLEGLSVALPTGDNKNFAVNHPKFYEKMKTIDDKIAHWPLFRGWGDFYILTMAYQGK